MSKRVYKPLGWTHPLTKAQSDHLKAVALRQAQLAYILKHQPKASRSKPKQVGKGIHVIGFVPDSIPGARPNKPQRGWGLGLTNHHLSFPELKYFKA